MTDSKENKVNQILEEDKNNVIDRNEIDRIFKLYLNRIATPEESDRFDGVHEDEKKVLIDYCNEEKTKTQDENKVLGDANKIQGDLANKEMKIQGDNALQQMKQLGAIPPAGAMPTAGAMPMPAQGQQLPPTQGAEPMGAPGKKFAQDGRFFPVRFE